MEATVIQTVVQIFGTLLFVAIVLMLKRFLNACFNFKNVDRNIYLMVIAEVVAGVLIIAGLYSTPLKESIGDVVLTILVVQGIIQVQFGFKLLKLPDELGGMLKPFCYTNILTGVLLASIVLIPLGIVASAISDLMLATIYLNMSRLLRTVDHKV